MARPKASKVSRVRKTFSVPPITVDYLQLMRIILRKEHNEQSLSIQESQEERDAFAITESAVIMKLLRDGVVSYCLGQVPVDSVLARYREGERDPDVLFAPDVDFPSYKVSNPVQPVETIPAEDYVHRKPRKKLKETLPAALGWRTTEEAERDVQKRREAERLAKEKADMEAVHTERTREIPQAEIDAELRACAENVEAGDGLVPPAAEKEPPADGLFPGMEYTFANGKKSQIFQDDIDDIRAGRLK